VLLLQLLQVGMCIRQLLLQLLHFLQQETQQSMQSALAPPSCFHAACCKSHAVH
jgi:hypothetical protein